MTNSAITLETVLYHARIDYDSTDATAIAYYQSQLNSAVLKSKKYLNRTICDTEAEALQAVADGDLEAMAINDAIFSAICIWFTYLVDNKQGECSDNALQAFCNLLDDYRLTPGI